ncbi:C45 family autoproteolytic acyltransferase/hydrolase [Streptomyces sp. NPDC091292]|uniref:C45 family autoproteolytic acyltransferase/hydolase n=1 Tax=Streptomyces sp. NPDC091292 TaxID=3365991 RepID=UPI0038096117
MSTAQAAATPVRDPLIVRTTGGARERGRQYGTAARQRILLSLENYERVYAKFAALDWGAATALAETFVPAIQEVDESLLDEVRGIAEGAGVSFDDVLALNLRTEILFSGKARKIAAAGASRASAARTPLECTSFCDLRGSEPVVGQNWDWIPFSHETVVVLEAAPDAGPRWVSVVEAGLLAKFGMNSAGLTVLTNALVTSLDVGSPGMPYHLLLRMLLGAGSVAAGEELLRTVTRSSSANYLLVGRDGKAGDGEAGDVGAVDLECRPGGPRDVSALRVRRGGLLVHANHFDSGDSAFASAGTDHGPRVMPDTLFRRARATALAELMPVPSVAGWHEVLSDHENYPDALCCHPNPREHPLEQGSTVASALIEPHRSTLRLTLGHPCTAPRVTYDYEEFFAGAR